jgi:hypothetical protein
VIELNPAVVKTTFCSVDWGYTNPGVIQAWALDGDGRMYLVHEVYKSRELIDWWVAQALRIKANFSPVCFVADPSEPAYIEQFQRAGMHTIPAENSLAPGIQAVQARLAVQSDGRPRLFLLSGACEVRDEALAAERKPTCTEQEFDAYLWSKSADGRPNKEEPIKLYDHGMDCCRYAVMWADNYQRVGRAVPEFGGRSTPAPRGVYGGKRTDGRKFPKW